MQACKIFDGVCQALQNDAIWQVLSLQHLEESLDPTIELTRLVKEHKLEEAFNKALSLSDVAVVSWLCMQVGVFSDFAREYWLILSCWTNFDNSALFRKISIA